MTGREIEMEYNRRALGQEVPAFIYVTCPECDRSFSLVKGRENEICEHLRRIINEKSR